MAAEAVAFFHIDVTFSCRRSDDFLMARKAQLLGFVQEKFVELRGMRAVAHAAFPLLYGGMPVGALLCLCFHLPVACIAQFRQGLEGNPRIVACMRVVTYSAVLFLERRMNISRISFEEHARVAA